jgi:hypothetical protein
MFFARKLFFASNKMNPSVSVLKIPGDSGDNLLFGDISLNSKGDRLVVGLSSSKRYGFNYIYPNLDPSLGPVPQVNTFGVWKPGIQWMGWPGASYPEGISFADPSLPLSTVILEDDLLPTGTIVLLNQQTKIENNGFWVVKSGGWENVSGLIGGRVRVYGDTNGSMSWSRVGNIIHGTTHEARFGQSVGIDDAGENIVVGEPYYDPDNAGFGQGRAFSYGFNSETWGQTHLSEGFNVQHQYGQHVAISSNGKRLMIASGGFKDIYASTPNYQGTVRILQQSDSSPFLWNALGSDISGFRWHPLHDTVRYEPVAFSPDGSRVAICGELDNSDDIIRVYEWTPAATDTQNTWRMLGPNVLSGVEACSLSLNRNGTAIAVGSLAGSVGTVRVLAWNGNSWQQFGPTLSENSSTTDFGYRVRLNSAGNRLLVSGRSGSVHLYEWNGANWIKQTSVFMDKIGHATTSGNFNNFGDSLAINSTGNVFAVGYPSVSSSINEDGVEFLPGIPNIGNVYTYKVHGALPTNSQITITRQPEDQPLSGLGNATFSVSAVAPNSVLSYQWEKQASGTTGFKRIPNATRSTLNLSGLNEQNSGDFYRVVIKATNGAATVTSNTVSLFGSSELVAYHVYSSTDIDGLYCLSGSLNGKRYWQRQGSTAYIYFLPSAIVGGMGYPDGWYIGKTLGQRTQNVYYVSLNISSDLPPVGGRSVWSNGFANNTDIDEVANSFCLPNP